MGYIWGLLCNLSKGLQSICYVTDRPISDVAYSTRAGFYTSRFYVCPGNVLAWFGCHGGADIQPGLNL